MVDGGGVLDGVTPVPLPLAGAVVVPELLPGVVAAGEVTAPGALDCGVEAGAATLPEVAEEPEVVVVVLAAPAAPEIPPPAPVAGAAPAGAMFCPIALPLTTSSTRRFN